MLSNAGVRSTHTQLLYNFANNILSCFGAFTGALVTDRINRRPRLYFGAFSLAVLLSIVAALSSKFGAKGNTDVNGAHATITFIFLFGIVYSFTYTPLQALYCAEVMDQRTRAKGMGGAFPLSLSSLPSLPLFFSPILPLLFPQPPFVSSSSRLRPFQQNITDTNPTIPRLHRQCTS